VERVSGAAVIEGVGSNLTEDPAVQGLRSISG